MSFEGKENKINDPECDISSEDSWHDLTSEVPLSLSASMNRKSEQTLPITNSS